MKVTDNGVAVWCALRRLGGYQTNRDIAQASGLSYRSTRWLTFRLSNIGLLKCRPKVHDVTFPIATVNEYALGKKPPADLVERADEYDAMAQFRAERRKAKAG